MTSSYDSTGIVLDRFADVVSRMEALEVSEYGDSIDLSEDEFLGHINNQIGLLVGEINEVLQSVYDAISVSNSNGAQLGNLLELVGLEYLAETYSTTTLTLTANKATTVPAGTRYNTATDVTFATDEELVFTAAGSDTVAATCTITGPHSAAASTIVEIKDSVFGITAVNNVAAAVPGRYQETATELKARHTIAVAATGNSSAGRIYEQVSEVDGVSDVYVFDNDTSSIAADLTPAHTVHVSTIGGVAAEIAEAIDLAKVASVPTYGATATVVYDATTSQAKTINHDIALETDIHIALDITTATGVFPDDGQAQIKAALVAHFDAFKIGDDVIYNALYGPITSIPGTIVNTLEVWTSDPPAGHTSDISRSALEKATLETADIDITVT